MSVSAMESMCTLNILKIILMLETFSYHSNQFPEHLFNLKFAVKDLERSSKKCEKEEKLERAKAKKALQKGNVDVARIHAENAIRQKNQSINYLRMSARVDAASIALTTPAIEFVTFLVVKAD